jgi:membrane protein CcdC involved in cytochrome C biogenesis
LAIAPVCLAWALLSAREFSRVIMIAAGLLLGIATCMRTNLGYVAALIAVAIALRPGGGAIRARALDVVQFAAAATVVALVCLLPYFLKGQLDLLFRSVILAPLAHSTSRKSTLETIIGLTRVLAKPDHLLTLSVISLAVVGALRMAISAAIDSRHLYPGYWLLAFLVAVSWSVMATGASHPHYLIQILPFCAVASVYALNAGSAMSRYVRPAGLLLLACSAVVSFMPIASRYGTLLRSIADGSPVAPDRAREVAALLLRDNGRREGVYLMEDHIVHWLTQTKPLTRMSTHPSNISKPRVIALIEGPQATPQSELQRIFAMNPAYVVKSATPYYLQDMPAELDWINGQLGSRYELVARIQGLDVHRLKRSSGAVSQR